MKKWIPLAFVILLPLAAMAEETETDDCLYNQEAFQDMLAQLRAQYPHSKYTEDKRAVEISFKDATVTVSYGGCEHYGTDIRYVADSSNSLTTKEAFTKSVDLVRQFGQKIIDPKVLGKLLSQKNYEEIQSGIFSIPYPEMTEFTIEIGKDSGHSTIIISYYN